MRKLGPAFLFAMLCCAVRCASGTPLDAVSCSSESAPDAATCIGDPLMDCVDDGIFCNGIERLVDGRCIKVPAAPCDDGNDCTIDTCDEAKKTCAHTPMGDCAMCQRTGCVPDCRGARCGTDGCGGTCGTCGPGRACTAAGSCVLPTGPGTCAQPRRLAVALGADKVQVLHGDTTHAINELTPTCDTLSTGAEDVYTFTLTAPTGIEATSHGFDSVLSIRRADKTKPADGCRDDSPAATVTCNDDSAPPGDYGSRVTSLLPPGTYFLVVDASDQIDFGPYTLTVKFIAGCIPNCDGQYCNGSDGCGGTCGKCSGRQVCGPDLRCRPSPCHPACRNDDGSMRTCGDDGCLGSCGSCPSDKLCVPRDGHCAAFPVCDHNSPLCNPSCVAGSFCGSDCACHRATDPLPDLIVNEQRLTDEILMDSIAVDANSCSVAERCVGGTGQRRLLRFSVEAINQGQAPLTLGSPQDRPDQFIYSPCHGHYHFNDFAAYALLNSTGNEVVPGRKQAFCMEDTRLVLHGPSLRCDRKYTCTHQGIQAGWSDLYGNSLDCQWLDITDVPAGDYQIRVTLNPNRVFEEVTTANNTSIVPVHIDAWVH